MHWSFRSSTEISNKCRAGCMIKICTRSTITKKYRRELRHYCSWIQHTCSQERATELNWKSYILMRVVNHNTKYSGQTESTYSTHGKFLWSRTLKEPDPCLVSGGVYKPRQLLFIHPVIQLNWNIRELRYYISQGSSLKSAHSLLIRFKYCNWITKELMITFLSKDSLEKIWKAIQFHISYWFSASGRNLTINSSHSFFSINSYSSFIQERILQVFIGK